MRISELKENPQSILSVQAVIRLMECCIFGQWMNLQAKKSPQLGGLKINSRE
jgi:hypothetical protein